MFAGVKPKALLFDFYGTLVDIETEEHDLHVWETIARFLRYRGSNAPAEQLRATYIAHVDQALAAGKEPHPEVDVVAIFGTLAGDASLGVVLAQLFRSLTIRRFTPFPEAHAVIAALAKSFPLALVSDSQEPYIVPELRMARLEQTFPIVVISSRYGYRKPDPRLFHEALHRLGVTAADAIYVGDSWTHDVVGATNAGIHPVWIRRNPDVRKPDTRKMDILRSLKGLLRLRPPQ
jgi:putative hydrolase of the HAD superfamily